MKNIKIISSLMLALSLFVASCSSDGDGNLPDLERVPIPLLKLDDKADVLIQEPAEFKGKFTVDMYFKDDIAPKQVDVVVAKNGDYKTVKVIQAAVTTFPLTVEVDAAKLATAFGMTVAQIVPGDYFEVGANIVTQSGLTVPAFSDLSNQFSADISNFPGSSLSLKYSVVCPLDLTEFLGKSTIEDPGFMGYDYPVTVTREGENVLVVTGFVDDPKSVIKVTIDPRTARVSVPSTLATPSIFGYNNLRVAGTGEINACENTITINMSYNVDEGSFGSYAFKITKP
jgi:hypothetical protein